MIYKVLFTSDEHLTLDSVQQALEPIGKVLLIESKPEDAVSQTITETQPDLQYKLEDFESQEEFNKYKESVYFAKLGVKITK